MIPAKKAVPSCPYPYAKNRPAQRLLSQPLSVVSNGVRVLECWYDGFGRRIAKREVLSGQTNRFLYVYSGWSVIAVLDGGSGEMLEHYTRGLGVAGDIGTIVAVSNVSGGPSRTFYVHSNRRGDVTTIRSNTTTIATFDYDAYGGVRSSTGSFDMRFRFSSKELDRSSGLQYFGYRYLHSSAGRWTSQDPLGEFGGLNQYSFCGANPICFVEPVGLRRDPACVAACKREYLVRGYRARNVLLATGTGGAFGLAAGGQAALRGSAVKAGYSKIAGGGKSRQAGNILRKAILDRGGRTIGPKSTALGRGVRAFGRAKWIGPAAAYTAAVGVLSLHAHNLAGYWGCVSGCRRFRLACH